MSQITVRWHGRGGQGSFTAARLLGHAAALHAGRQALAIPAFGPERRGAPVVCVTRISDEPIRDRGPARTCDLAIALDPSMADTARAGLADHGRLLVNSAAPVDGGTAIDADRLAREAMGKAVPGSVMLGALAAFGVVAMPALDAAVTDTWEGHIRSANLTLLHAGFQAVGMQGPTGRASCASRKAVAAPPAIHRSALRPWRAPASLAELPIGPSLSAGHLVTGFAGWRSERPRIDPDACVTCGHCWLACPDGAVMPGENGLAIDLEMCKGCGICVSACQAGAITMGPETEDG